ncbi:MAG: HAMP domain-containing protein [Planctomycetota bacterium]|nr:MAG: HAMP domain-containing protein [Planctomycetota bacterium]
MRRYKDLAINNKLTVLVVLAGSVSLVLSCIAFVTNDVRMIRLSMIDQISTLAEVLGSNSTAALSFRDAETATELLLSLEKQPNVDLAVIYDAAGNVFATYDRSQGRQLFPPEPPRAGYEFAGGYLDVSRRIEHDGQVIGTIYLHTSMRELYDQIFWYVNIVAAVMIGSLLASIVLSSRVQRAISQPILELANAANRISIESDYGLRVEKIADDELGILYDQFNVMLEQIQQRDAAIQRANDELEAKVESRTSQLQKANDTLQREVAERRRAETELAEAQHELMASARRAGMAEIATGVLHNVGNVLNSINVSARLASDRMRQSKVGDLTRVVKLLDEHAADLATFIGHDPKGKRIPAFLDLLSTHLADERADILKELELLNAKIDHIKAIISTQQSYAGVSGVTETVDIATLIDDAMSLNSASLDRHHVAVSRDYAHIPPVKIDKQKALQILVNLIKNAKDACAASSQNRRHLEIRTRLGEAGTVQIHVVDNGVGIPRDHLTRIFSHGFTTKKTGHGFGLHSCANAAQELGGSLVAFSDGPGTGATFVLEFPYEPAEAIV